METALQQLVQRHEALRTTVEAGGERQLVHAAARPAFVLRT
jgi:hypothetical protein